MRYTMKMKQKIAIITLGVESLETSKEFYEDILGFVPVVDDDEDIVFYDMETVRLALFQRNELAKDATVDAGGSGFKGYTLAHCVASSKVVDSLFAELKEKGVTVVKEPGKVFWGGYSGYFSDPDGHLWEVAHNPFTDMT